MSKARDSSQRRMIDKRRFKILLAQSAEMLTMADISRSHGIRYDRFNRLVSGRHLPRKEEIQAICDALGVKPDDILQEA